MIIDTEKPGLTNEEMRVYDQLRMTLIKSAKEKRVYNVLKQKLVMQYKIEVNILDVAKALRTDIKLAGFDAMINTTRCKRHNDYIDITTWNLNSNQRKTCDQIIKKHECEQINIFGQHVGGSACAKRELLMREGESQ